MDTKGLRTWVEIDRKALRYNYQLFRRLITKQCLLMAVTKSNAYGHSLVDFSREVAHLGVDWIGVDSIVEAQTLRREQIQKPILILGGTLKENFDEAARLGVSITISTFEGLRAATLRKNKTPLKIHIKVDTGMHRQGFFVRDIQKVIKYFLNNRNIIFEGLYTHFAAAKNPAFPQYTQNQINEFEKVSSLVENAELRPLKHASASSGVFLFPSAHFDLVRVGIALYGLWPSLELKAAFDDQIKLKPILAWKSVISEVKTLQKGDRVGYDLTEGVHKLSRVAIVPVGYWHGYCRDLSSIGYVLICRKRAKVIGRVSMDMIVVDVSKIKNIKIGDEVTLIGKGVSADEVAHLAGTINYEIVTRINPKIKRFYI